MLPGSHGAGDEAVASCLRGLWFDLGSIQMYFSSHGFEVVGRKMELEVKYGKIFLASDLKANIV